ncbi:MAG: sugar phosphate isomerase/epimerase family protein [Promethearchaeota archaeon]
MIVALNTYSLRNEWKQVAKHDKMDNVARLAQDAGITQIEWLDRHVDEESIQTNLKILEDHGVGVFAFGPHVHLLAREKDVEKEIEDGKHWLNLAAEHGIPKIRVQVGDGPMPRCFPPMPDFDEEEEAEYQEMIHDAVGFTEQVTTPLIEEAEKLGVLIGIETHHSYSSNHYYMAQFNERFDSKNIGWIFDIGNYENDEMRWKGLDTIKERTFYIHAKAYKFDDEGFEVTLDYPRAAKILGDAGFRGEWSIEFEGKMNGLLGILRTNELVKFSIAKWKGEDYAMNLDFPAEKELMARYA